jgi:hypothetical protein
MGATPKNIIIYNALKYAYFTDINVINNDYFYSCRNLFNIVQEGNATFDFKYKLYQERFNDNNSAKLCNNATTLAIHYWKSKTIPPPVKNNIPNIIHFCFGLIEQTEPFFFTYYLAILSAKLVNNPDKIYFYYHYEPYGKWWELIKPHIILEKIDVPTHIGSKPVLKTANKADIVRMNKLYERGGVYFDIDTISIRPYAELLKYNCVLGWEVENERTCNAIMFTEPNSKFFTIWLEQYEKHFVPEGWIEACNILPGTLAKDLNDENIIKLLPPDYFFRPFFDETPNIFENNVDIPNKLHSLHLWETYSLKYLRNIDIDWIYSNKHTLYSKMVFELINNYNLLIHLIH